MSENKVLGRGAFGSVEKCKHKQTGEEAAVKILKKMNFKK